MKGIVRCAAELTVAFVLLTPSLAFGQSDISCFDSTVPVHQELGKHPVTLPEGLGSFQLPDLGSAGLTVHYVRPESFISSSPILLVLPGAGRNSDDYRDAWIDAACTSGTLLAALGYPEEHYDFAAYNMGGTISNLHFDNPSFARVSETATTITLDDADIRFDVVTNSPGWLFEDFDHFFEKLVEMTASDQKTYDFFGILQADKSCTASQFLLHDRKHALSSPQIRGSTYFPIAHRRCPLGWRVRV